jgi:hypothetical protein
MKTQVIIFAVLVAFSQGEVFNRVCRTVEQYGGAWAPFSPTRFLNKWFEIER